MQKDSATHSKPDCLSMWWPALGAEFVLGGFGSVMASDIKGCSSSLDIGLSSEHRVSKASCQYPSVKA